MRFTSFTSNMSPGDASNGTPGCDLRDSEAVADFGVGQRVGREEATHFDHLSGSQFSRSTTSLSGAIDRVVLLRPEEQVFRANAKRVVAPVQDEQAIRHRPVVKLPREAVSQDIASAFTTASHDTVAESRDGAGPLPAPIRLAHLLPKAILGRNANAGPTAERACAGSNSGRRGSERLAARGADTLNPRRPDVLRRRWSLGQALRVVRIALVAIPDVIALRAQLQVRRIDAPGIVALMANNHPFGDGSVGQFPRDTMRGATTTTSTQPSEHAVTEWRGGPRPQPAPIRAGGAIHLGPEQLGERLWLGARATARRAIFGGHQNLTFWCRARGGLQTALGYFYAHFTPFHAVFSE